MSAACLGAAALDAPGALGEELGWRGYLHKRIGGGLSALLSCLIVGVLWALWHVGVYTNGAAYMAFFVTLMVSYTVVIYVLIADTGLNVLLAAIFHLMINVTNVLSVDSINDVGFIAVNALVWAGIAVAIVLINRPSFIATRPNPGGPASP
jgi:membrane protease YdiL (CAAX protease family)